MTKMTAKRAFVTSVTALFLCFAMLLGTTFAWFTDSVSSTNNIIKSGNLDIVLEYWDGDSWENVQDASDILTNDLWEPGAARVAYLRAANVGTLALKYQLGVNVVSETEGTNAAGESFKLSDYLQFGVVEGVNGETDSYTADATGRAAAIADAVDAKKISEGYTKSNALYPVGNIPADVVDGVSEIYLALVVYMPEDVDNDANYKTSEDANDPDKYRPLINLGINVVATQVEAEFDSFGDDYDANAPVPVAVTTVEELVAAFANSGSYILTADLAVEADTTITVPANASVEIDLNGNTIAGVTVASNDDGRFTSADNEVLFDVRGSLTVKNGTVTLKHEGDNYGWNACTDVFYVGFNGTLNVENATIENLGGSDMAYAIDLVNATNITVNVQNSTLKSSYIAVRVFNNSKTGMNNLTIKDSALEGTSRALWVHQYTAADNGGTDANLNLDFFGNGNTFTATNNAARIIEFGFTDAINFDANGNQITIN